MAKNQRAFEGYQKQAVEDILHRRISTEAFQKARQQAERNPAVTMQRRIELIAQAVR